MRHQRTLEWVLVSGFLALFGCTAPPVSTLPAAPTTVIPNGTEILVLAPWMTVEDERTDQQLNPLLYDSEAVGRTLQSRARAEIGRIFSTYSASLMKDFQESVTAGDFSASSEQQLVQQAIKTFSAQELNGVQIVDHWIHPVSGEMFALARLDLEGFMDKLTKAKELSAKVKEEVKRSAAKSFADLEAEEAKRMDQ